MNKTFPASNRAKKQNIMSKQSKEKEKQGYTRTLKTCGNCKHFHSKLTTESNAFGSWTNETNLRCIIGGFKVHKTATCNMHETL